VSAWFEHWGFGQVGDELLIGAYPQDADDVQTLADAGVTCVFNLVQDIEYEGKGREACAKALKKAGIVEERVEVVDYGNLLPGHIERAVKTVRPWLADGECVYVHCRAGMQRSATVAAAIVALEEGVEPTEALRRVSERNPRANPLEHQRQDLLRWWKARAGE
jgi:atypical dual specificity phosphatase